MEKLLCDTINCCETVYCGCSCSGDEMNECMRECLVLKCICEALKCCIKTKCSKETLNCLKKACKENAKNCQDVCKEYNHKDLANCAKCCGSLCKKL